MAATVTAVGGQKGGVGKSMIAGNLAVCLAIAGYRVGVIDTDYSQNTTDHWHRARAAQDNVPAIACESGEKATGDNLIPLIERWSEQYDHVLIDTNGSDNYELRTALGYARHFITPLQPLPSDAWTAGAIERLYLEACEINPALSGLLVLSLVNTHPGGRKIELEATREALDAYPGLPRAKTLISKRAAWWRAWAVGLGVTELKPSRDTQDAILEANQLYQEVYAK